MRAFWSPGISPRCSVWQRRRVVATFATQWVLPMVDIDYPIYLRSNTMKTKFHSSTVSQTYHIPGQMLVHQSSFGYNRLLHRYDGSAPMPFKRDFFRLWKSERCIDAQDFQLLSTHLHIDGLLAVRKFFGRERLPLGHIRNRRTSWYEDHTHMAAIH